MKRCYKIALCCLFVLLGGVACTDDPVQEALSDDGRLVTGFWIASPLPVHAGQTLTMLGTGFAEGRCRPFRERNRQLRKSARTSLRELCLHDRSSRHGFGRLRPDTGARGGIATSGAGEPAHNARSDTDSRPRRGDDQGRRLLRDWNLWPACACRMVSRPP